MPGLDKPLAIRPGPLLAGRPGRSRSSSRRSAADSGSSTSRGRRIGRFPRTASPATPYRSCPGWHEGDREVVGGRADEPLVRAGGGRRVLGAPHRRGRHPVVLEPGRPGARLRPHGLPRMGRPALPLRGPSGGSLSGYRRQRTGGHVLARWPLAGLRLRRVRARRGLRHVFSPIVGARSSSRPAAGSSRPGRGMGQSSSTAPRGRPRRPL